MCKFNHVYGSRFLKAADLNGASVRLQVEAAEWQEVGRDKEEKIVLAFFGKQKILALNASNARTLAEAWGKEEVQWPGNWLEAKAVQTAFGPGVQVRPAEAPIAVGEVPF